MSLIVPTLNAWGAAFAGFALPMLAQSTVVILLLLGLDWLLRGRVRATVRYALCLLALVKLVLPPSLALPTGAAYWLSIQTGGEFVDAVPTAPSAPASATASWEMTSAPDTRAASRSRTQSRIDRVALPISPTLTWRAAAVIVWLVVSAAMVFWVFRRSRLVSAVIRRSVEAPESVRGLAENCRRQLGIRRSVPVRLSAELGSPAVGGVLRPVILIPPSLAESLDRSEMRGVLLHEMAHLKRGDLWMNHAQILLQVVYWYHPLLWLANARLRRLREQAVDEMTLVELRDEAETYPETLFHVAKLSLRGLPQTTGMVGIFDSGHGLTDRIRIILSQPLPRTARIGLRGLLALLVLAFVTLPMSCAPSWSVAKIRMEAPTAAAQAQASDPPRPSDPFWIQSEFEKIKSTSVLYPVIDDLKLEKKWGATSGLGRDMSKPEAYDMLSKQIDVKVTKNDTILEIWVYDQDKNEAMEIAKSIKARYAALRDKNRSGQNPEESEALEAQLKPWKAEIFLLQTNLEKILGASRTNNDPGSDGLSSMDKTSGDETSLSIGDLQIKARAEYAGWKALYDRLTNMTPAGLQQAMPTVMPDQELAILMGSLHYAGQSLAALTSPGGNPPFQAVAKAKALRDAAQAQVDEKLQGMLMGLSLRVDHFKAEYESMTNLPEQTKQRVVRAIQQPPSGQQNAYFDTWQKLEFVKQVTNAIALRVEAERAGRRSPATTQP